MIRFDALAKRLNVISPVKTPIDPTLPVEKRLDCLRRNRQFIDILLNLYDRDNQAGALAAEMSKIILDELNEEIFKQEQLLKTETKGEIK